ncbi:PREDICTED: ankyrin repeat domain-containing protein SOWAHC [Papilio polytes]|uniref:ankyrin repeat domain-containing protein SOWAHC n=1 Tax=Papilio polytes TaxID=76194 RepID=UPI0006766413|nr:PREDICTED: ankyrin repeat domain-containing protein SOWAHC [Papilio polytes]
MTTPPSELNFDEILKFMLAHNGKVTNFELVKHFKMFLMNPDMRDEARSTFKKHVNALAIMKNQNNEKWLILKKKYMPVNIKDGDDVSENKVSEPLSNVSPTESATEATVSEPATYQPELPLHLNQDFSVLTSIIQDTNLNDQNSSGTPKSDSKESLFASTEDIPPKVHPRRKASEKLEKQSSLVSDSGSRNSILTHELSEQNDTSTASLSSSRSESMLLDNEQKISVKERKQMFNRMASESDVPKHKIGFNNSSVDEGDKVSLDHKNETDPLDSKQKQWILCAARGEYHSLAKMCKDNPKLVRTKDPFTGYTAMHWACKRGDENLVKLLAGVARQVINERSNGGYTPLHIAIQFRNENVYNLLVDVYDADPNVRDWSGRKARQYLVRMDTSLSPGSYRKKEGFLRIGSLNVRVKKTTEAFSNFLGVGATRSSGYVPKLIRERDLDRRSDDGEQLHKSWGSADNIPKNDKMPPPMSNKVRRRGASGRRNVGSHSRSTPSTPDQPRAQIGVSEERDSDSDSAAGFHSAWKQRASCT